MKNFRNFSSASVELGKNVIVVGKTMRLNQTLYTLFDSRFFKSQWGKVFPNGPSKFMTDHGKVFDVADTIEGNQIGGNGFTSNHRGTSSGGIMNAVAP